MSRIQACFSLTFLLCAASLAQETTGTLAGEASDSSGAVIPNVNIVATNIATNAAHEVKTDSSGAYSIPFLPAGDYSVIATLSGFQVQRIERLTLQVQQTARIDFHMSVGSITETVNVAATAAALQTENATVGTVIDSTKIVELPPNGRNFVQLAQLIPGVQAGRQALLRCAVAGVPWASPTPPTAVRPPPRMVSATPRTATCSTGSK
jgi:hypothetical protein